ncbi:MAG: AI-2E family transporter [Salinarimonas sp.]|nr:AI-2E family transporter [Salinarimonas sp.]
MRGDSDKARDPVRTLIILSLAILLAIMVGWLLVVGKDILLPIVIAVLSAYVMSNASRALGRWPVTRLLPSFVRRLLLLMGFIGVIFAFNGVVIVTVRDLVASAPGYQANLERLVTQVMAMFGTAGNPDWQAVRAVTIDRIDMTGLIGGLAGSVGALVGVLFMAVVYALFLTGEAGSFAHKISVALPGQGQADKTMSVIADINERIADYLAIKTLINIILASLSFVILWLFGVDYALFWALIIGILNYIPYFGSLLGVAFPVLLTVVQFGSLTMTLLIAGMLTAAQMWVGNFLEPRMIGRKVNLSPFVVLVALSFWYAFWGIPGAILAVPMTSMLAIIFAAFDQTRPLAVLLANDVSVFERREAPALAAPRPADQPEVNS